MPSTIYNVQWEELLPEALRKDERIAALAQVIAKQKRKIADEIWRVRVWTEIDRMPEKILDLLAYDMKIDWWDDGYSIEEKRRTIKSAWSVHERMGTKAAVETAISAIYPGTKVKEWFEYGGDPYMFRLEIDATYENVSPEKHQRVLERVEYYKNLRSYLEGVDYVAKPDAYCTAYMGIEAIGIGMQMTVEVENYGAL